MLEELQSEKKSNRIPLAEVPGLIKDSFVEFFQQDALFHGAALAYYTLFAMVPLLYLSISFLGRIIGQDVMLDIISTLLKNKVGIQDISGIMDFMKSFDFEKGNWFVDIISIIALLIASSAFIVCLKRSVNDFFGLDVSFSSRRKAFFSTIIFRLLSIVYVGVITIIIIILYFAQTIILSLSSNLLDESVFFSRVYTEIMQHGFAILGNVLIFTIVLKYVHNGYVQWKLAIGGAIFTSILLYIGQLIIKYYLYHFFFLAGGGLAGTLFIILTWVYYSSQIIFYGAKFTAVYARKIGKPIQFKG